MPSEDIGMSTHRQTAHGRCENQPTMQEPDFDPDRVIWDADYRHDVLELLRQWRLLREREAEFTPNDKKAA
jgi:hypothetical protein